MLLLKAKCLLATGLFLLITAVLFPQVTLAQPAQESDASARTAPVMEGFNQRQVEAGEAVKIEDKLKHQVLFVMGVLLLVLILVTAGLGISMAMFGKQVFLPHMIFAGASVFLSLAHAVTAIVWFFPY